MTEDATFYVYLISRLDGRPCYVGKGKGERWQHRGSYGRNKRLISIMRQAKAQGTQLPCVKVLDGITEEHAFRVEKGLIAFFGRADKGEGLLVNLTDGGDGPAGYKPTAEDKARRRQAGWKPHTSESRALISKALKGRKKTPEHIAAAAAGQRGGKKSFGWWSTEEGRAKQRQNNPSPFQKGHKHSLETLAKLKASGAAYWARRKAAEASKENQS